MTTDPNPILFCHPELALKVRNKITTTRVTIAYKIYDQGVELGVSFCGVKDTFRKDKGRDNATAQLKSRGFFINTYKTCTRPEAVQLVKNVLEASILSPIALPGVPTSWRETPWIEFL